MPRHRIRVSDSRAILINGIEGSVLSFAYRAYGLAIASDFPLRGPSAAGDATTDIAIARHLVPTELSAVETETVHWQANAGELLLDVPGVGRFLVRDGREVRYDPHPSANDAALEPFLLGTCLGAAMLQRGRLVLHAAVVDWKGKAVAICGKSGAGKSTTSALLIAHGGRMISDDLGVFESTEPPIVAAGFPQSKLTAEALARIGLSSTGLRRLGDDDGKYAVPREGAHIDTPQPLNSIVVLERSTDGTARIERLTGAEAIRSLIRHNYRRHMVMPSQAARNLRNVGNVARQVPVWRIVRPRGRDSTEWVSSAISRLLENRAPLFADLSL